VIARPFASRLDLVNCLASETCTALIFLLSSFCAFSLGSTLRSYLSQVAVTTILVTISLNSLFSVIKAMQAVRVLLQGFKQGLSTHTFHWRRKFLEEPDTSEVTPVIPSAR